MKDDIFSNAPNIKQDHRRAAQGALGRIVDMDIERYLPLLDDPELTEAQKRQVIESMAAIMITFVELSFGTHPASQACGQVDLCLDHEASSDSNTIEHQAGPLCEDFNHDPDN
ncbi:MAG: hypothetical protein AAF718_03545 [Pseudomonadota bacterium]